MIEKETIMERIIWVGSHYSHSSGSVPKLGEEPFGKVRSPVLRRKDMTIPEQNVDITGTIR